MGKSLIASYRTTVAMLAVFAVIMAIATFVEKFYGTTAAKVFFYYNPFFFILLLLLVINLIASSVENRLVKQGKTGYIVLHSAIIVILAGALTSHITGQEGFVHLRNGETVNNMQSTSNKGHLSYTLPFEIELVKFTLKRYPGSDSPSSYESLVRIHDKGKVMERLISMNNTLDYRGYRFFQMSYDKDEQGSNLSVNRDLAGRSITYAGYGLLVAGFALSFAAKGSRVRRLITKLGD
ncbi:MAG: cytochrome c biogenesis protein ResB [Dysgonamonadaceae bacterium]|jgi:hypothetical protein|nr:cytochrome c biogenesis protein ResB [Dysgonamonadaceae bacterium]